jgi:hypothetical protein
VPLVKGIVQRGGPYVKEITFGYRWLKISQAILDHITEHCSQLKSLNLGCCIINGNLSKLLKKFAPQLEIFTLEESTWVNEDDPHEVSNYLSHFKAIKDLNLRKAKFNLDPIVHLPPYIECIDISASKQITGNALGYFFETHSHLKSFHMSPLPQSLIKSYSYFLQYDEDPEEGGLQTVIDSMKHLINLETLELGFIPHDAYSLRIDPISNLTSLKTLSLEACDCLTQENLQIIFERMTNLESLRIVECTKIANYSPIGALQNLKHLHIEKTIQMCDQDLELVAQKGKLETLKLKKCFNITNKGVKYSIARCPLKELDLSNCVNIDDTSIRALVETDNKCRIKTLTLNTCPYITGKGIEKLAQCPQVLRSLQQLDVTRVKNVVNDSMILLHRALLSMFRHNQVRFKGSGWFYIFFNCKFFEAI